jgi:hypothetical protein
MKFYKDILVHTKKINISNKLFHNINGVYTHFNSSSSCIIPNSDSTGYLMNMRLVNYNIDGNGCYHNCDKHIITINKYLELDSNFAIKREKIINFEFVDKRYIGVEDVRIFRTNCNNEADALKFIGTGYHKNNKIGIVHGNYCPLNDDNSLKLQEIVPSFANSDCEKNWVYVNLGGELHVVYNWGPLKLCKIDDTARKLNLIKTIEMPNIFNFVRGSTCGANYKNEIWFVGHIVSYEQPRHYYHIFSVFDENMKLLRYSAPFKFDTECIEYCLGLIVEDDRVICTYSSWDRTTIIAVYDKKYIDGLIVYN